MSGKKKFTIGIDYGVRSVTAILVDVSNGKSTASATYTYSNGIITDKLPNTEIKLEEGWALQHPKDYISALKRTVPKLMSESGVNPDQIIGIGTAFAGSTLIPTTADGTPLALLEDFAKEPHAWPKHSHHKAAEEKAQLLTKIAADRFETFMDRYGGKINPDWFFPRVWEIFDDSSTVFNAADKLIEASDWIVWQLTGVESRNICAAGYKALWSKSEGYPLETFFGAMDPDLANIVDEKMNRDISHLGHQVGELTEEAAQWMDLEPGIPVASGNLSNHAAVPGATVAEPGKMAIILGADFFHIILSKKENRVPGLCGMVEDGVVPGLFAYQACQAGGSDHFTWFLENAVPERYMKEAHSKKIEPLRLLEEKAAALKPSESGLVALDWWKGNRSILVDRDLTGIILGYSLETKPEEIYRAILEATAFGTRKIFETFIASGVPINEIIIAGGESTSNKLLLNILANVARTEIKIAKSQQPSALGAAMYAAVAAGEARGGYQTIQEASQNMAHLSSRSYIPNNNDKKTYNRLYSEYTLLHDYFGYGHNNAMKRLINLRTTILDKKKR